MNSVNFKSVKLFINLILFLLCSVTSVKLKAWEVDFSRRQLEFTEVTDSSRLPASVETKVQDLSLMESVIDPIEPAQDLVILNTENGFVPSTLRLKRDGKYKIHIVNVNNHQKNISFVLEAFSEFHSTAFGIPKHFTITPKKEGVYTFSSPETAVQGQLVIYTSGTSKRNLASERK